MLFSTLWSLWFVISRMSTCTHLYIQSVKVECGEKILKKKKKKGFPNPFWLYQNSGSEWLAVVLAAQVPKDNLLQNILQNSLCWLRLRTGSKGHKCFAVKLQVLNFLPDSLECPWFLWLWTDKSLPLVVPSFLDHPADDLVRAAIQYLPVCIHNVFKLVSCRRKQYPINVPSVFWKK